MNKIFSYLPLFVLAVPSLYLVMKIRRLIISIFIVGILGGCATTSNQFEKSPCACEFENINVPSAWSSNHG